MTNERDLCKWAAEDGSFKAGTAVYATEEAVNVCAYWTVEDGKKVLVFETQPDAFDDKREREMTSWTLWVNEGVLGKLWGLREFVKPFAEE